jgi:hypothetical protein
MKILSLYLLIGTLFSAFTDYAHSKAKHNWPTVEEWKAHHLSNFDRVWLAIVWPVGILVIIVKLFSSND